MTLINVKLIVSLGMRDVLRMSSKFFINQWVSKHMAKTLGPANYFLSSILFLDLDMVNILTIKVSNA